MLIGLVGKPSAGKSTFFKAATLADAAIASYPFTTIKPNNGVGYVKIDCIDRYFGVQCNPRHGFCFDGKRFVPVEIMDVAGLVPGASEGKGLGNQFLDDLRQADVFIHIVDCSGTTDSEGKQVENHNPGDDIRFLEEELNKWFFNILDKAWKGFAKKLDQEGDFVPSVVRQFSGLKVKEDDVKSVLLDVGLPEKAGSWNREDLMKFASALRRKSKPMIIAANKIDMERSVDNYERMKLDFPELIIIPCSADSELALREADRAGLIKYISGEKTFDVVGELNEKQEQALNKISESALDVFLNGTGVQEILNRAVFELLGYLYIFPASANKLGDSKGNILPDCFLLPPHSTALDFAYFLHTDFGKNFIKAIDAKTKKALGKAYELKNGDALEIVTR
ncbi:MAG: redox-regulated ATPase YchF [Nanoarchaeota archaeon]|nr:redox-regulated ATPase YchF [Nanoarchaeota archaeon]